MLIMFGSDDQAGLGLPRAVTHLRLTSSQGAVVAVQWPETSVATRDFRLDRGRRADVPVANGHNGTVILARKEGTGPVYLAWILP